MLCLRPYKISRPSLSLLRNQSSISRRSILIGILEIVFFCEQKQKISTYISPDMCHLAKWLFRLKTEIFHSSRKKPISILPLFPRCRASCCLIELSQLFENHLKKEPFYFLFREKVMQMLCSVRSVEILHSVNAGQGYWSLAKFPILSVLFVVSRSRIGNAVGVQEQSVMSQQEASIDSMKR